MKQDFHDSKTPVVKRTNERRRIVGFGNAFTYDVNDPHPEKALATIRTFAHHHLSPSVKDRLHWQRFPGGNISEGKRRVLLLEHEPMFPSPWADGVILSAPRTAVAVATRDCPVLVLYPEDGGPMLVMHCGRDCLHNFPDDTHNSVIADGLAVYKERCRSGISDLRGFITLGIAPEYFQNDKYPDLVATLSREWGPEIVSDPDRLTLNLRELIYKQLEAHHIDRSQIKNDCLDTYSDPRLASVRQNGRNAMYNLLLVERLL